MASAIKCSNCGANLSVGDDAANVVCTYCGATNALRPAPAPAPDPLELRPRPSPRRPSSPAVSDAAPVQGSLPLVVVAGGLFLLVGGVVLYATSAVGQRPGELMQWNGSDQPLLIDVDGDGQVEVVGLVRLLEDGEQAVAVAAFDVPSGGRLWLTQLEGGEYGSLVLAAAGGQLWLGDGGGQLRALSTNTGQITTTMPLGERVDRFCGDGNGGLEVRLADKTARTVDVRSGALGVPAPFRWDTPCGGGIWGSDPGQTPTTRVEDNPTIAELESMFAPDNAVVTADGSWVAGVRRPGTRVPTIVARGPDGVVRWKVELPTGDPLRAKEGAPEIIGVGAGKVCAQWDEPDGETPTHLACLDAATGKPLWDVTLVGDVGDVSAIVIDGAYVYVSRWTWLQIFTIDGAEVTTIGVVF